MSDFRVADLAYHRRQPGKGELRVDSGTATERTLTVGDGKGEVPRDSLGKI